MKLIPEWKAVLWRAWSMRLMALSVVSQSLEVALPVFWEGAPVGWLMGTSIASAVLAAVARVIDQNLEASGV